MNREQMIAWLTLEGIALFTAPIIGDEYNRRVWEVWDEPDYLQRYMHKPDTWERYTYLVRDNETRAKVALEDLSVEELRELYVEISEHRHEPR